jgi:glutaminase A
MDPNDSLADGPLPPLRRDVGPSPITTALREMHAAHRGNHAGQVATYIPELAKADPGLFGIALAFADGEIYQVGDALHPFTIQSISKPLVYGLALEDHGVAHVLSKVGVEPTGEAFNSITMDEANNRPFNPMVNAGAIATAALIKGSGYEERLARILDTLSRYAGRPLEIDGAVFRSEKETGHRNRAIAYLELNAGMIDEPVLDHLDLYFAQCAVQVTARDLAVMAATLANNGVNPLTGARALELAHVKNVLSIMASCGMYDAAGDWIYRVGLPAKSGVAGGILAVLPGQFGIGVFSPPLDERGNSCRGVQVCEELSRRFNLHLFDTHQTTAAVVRRTYRGGTVCSKRLRRACERGLLDAEGGSILVYELQGDIYFASAEQIFRRLAGDAGELRILILDGRRVGRVDRSAMMLLGEMRDHMAARGARLVLAGFPESVRSALLDSPASPWRQTCFFADVDDALEWGEDQLIAADTGTAPGTTADVAASELQLAQMDILANLTETDIALLSPFLTAATFGPGEAIIREGDAADRLYLLLAGSAAVHVRPDDNGRTKRRTSIAPGVAFGELALFNGGRHTADVIAETTARCAILTVDRLDALRAAHPSIHQTLLINVGRTLAEGLRRANAEIRALET